MVGKTHTEEMAFSITGENAHYGTPINVAAEGRVPGGSSSGSAAAVAAGLVDFAIGSDTGGSVRAPASFCGLYGIRPTHGRVAMDGACPLAPSFDTCGWFARDAAVLSRVGEVLLRPTHREVLAAEPGRLLLAQDAFALVMPDANAAMHQAVAHIEQQLGAAEPVTVSEAGLSAWFEVFRTLQFAEIQATHGDWIAAARPTFGPAIAQRFSAVASADPALVAPALEARRAIATHLDELLRDNAILLLPSMPDIAPLRQSPADETIAFRERAMGMLCVAGLGRLPQVSVPFATVRGCPLGVSLVAARGNDELLLTLARQLTPPLSDR
jgi:amidase